MHAFDPNDYRKRVLAAVERRGGIETSDAFELYDIPLEDAERLTDVQVKERIDEVWGFWQKQRDHPKYRVLVGLLVDEHDELSEPLLRAASRRVEADRVRQLRARRDSERYEMLDTAIERLVARYGGVPTGKIPGLEDIGGMSGLNAAEIQARIRRHRLIDEPSAPAPAPAPGLDAGRRQQIRKLLAEYERLLPGDPVPTLLVLLGLDFTKAHQTGEIHLRAEALRSRTRELPPGRIRVVLDELLIHISDLLESGGPLVDEYLRAIVDDVTDLLRPQVRAAVLVEDHLVAADFDFLVGEAMTAGLDHSTAEQVLIGLTDELGTTVEGREHLAGSGAPVRLPSSAGAGSTGHGGTGGYRSAAGSTGHGGSGGATGTVGRGSASTGHGAPFGGGTGTSGGATASRAWEEPLRAARAALRAGRPREADQHVQEARRRLGGDSTGMTSLRPVADEVDRVLLEASLRWRKAGVAYAGRRYVEALQHLEYLEHTASDVPNPDPRGPGLDQLATTARAELAKADQLLASAPAAPAAARMRALRAIFDICADHAGATAALAALPVDAPGKVSAARKPDGTIVISWNPSPTEDAEYRVTRLQPDGSWRVVGRTRGTALEDGGSPTGPVPTYGVVASVSGRTSEMSRSDQAPPAPAVVPASGATTATGTPVTADGTATSRGTGTSAPAPSPSTGRIDYTRPPRRRDTTGTGSGPGVPPVGGSAAAGEAATGAGRSAQPGTSPAPGRSASPTGTASGAATGDMPAVGQLAEQGGLLVFDWPAGVTEVMVYARGDAPPAAPGDPQARGWKVTNTRYQIDGGARVLADIPRPCHLAVAACRREPSGTLTVAAAFGPDSHIHWIH
ncbi:hypothetical protein JK358_30545 [Nocardia sp. 2]|uniref:SaeA fourth Fn3-like domain-containing protein n=1 Tax=Nocardia acididurans TaxID=2802282 RepID=A0ABS1MDM0_9NOCA|nr:hypothetical protein [Nocardia acididurans]MBL1078751.1 hypothetical protein [Nocardia acididurans]